MGREEEEEEDEWMNGREAIVTINEKKTIKIIYWFVMIINYKNCYFIFTTNIKTFVRRRKRRAFLKEEGKNSKSFVEEEIFATKVHVNGKKKDDER